MENEVSQSLSLKIMVEKVKNKVIFVESNKDFIDVLFSFMTIPIGTIARLTREHSLGGEICCLNNLYESIGNLDVKFVKSQKCRDILLCPRSAAEVYWRNLKHKLAESDSNEYYACISGGCDLLSYYLTPLCRCGVDMGFKLNLPNATSVSQEGGVFIKPTVDFMISDDFEVTPMSAMTGISLLMSKLGVTDGTTIEQRTVTVGRDELLKLLKCSLTSRTPFTDTLMGSRTPFTDTSMGPPSTKTFYNISYGKYGPRSKVLKANEEKMISFKLIVSKSKNKALYAEANEDFLDLLSSFLRVPLGYVFKEFPSLLFRGCVNNLYKSIENIELKLFESEEMKETLVNPKLAPGLAYNNQLIGIEEAINPSYDTLISKFKAKRYNLSPSSKVLEAGEGLIKGPSSFIVMDNLTVMPLSSISGISLINKLQIPFADIGERVVTMGEDEALRLLVASLVSKCVLTDAFLIKEPRLVSQRKSMENEVSQSLSLKIIVEKVKNQVIFVESSKDFIDVLFSFMTIPIGTIAELTREHSLGGEIGCLNNLYESIGNLDMEFVKSQKCRDILLRIRSAAEVYWRNLKQKLAESDSDKYYACNSGVCSLLSYYQTCHCRCGEDLKRELNLPNATSVSQEGGVFVKPTVHFMISDDFEVKPLSTMTGISLPMSKLGVAEGKTIEERIVSVGRDELLKLLKFSLTSRTPFSDTFLGPPTTETFYKISRGKYGPRNKVPEDTNAANKKKMISLKLIVSKSKNKAFYAEANEDFLGLLCRFLTVPLGCVFKGFPSLPFRGCANNLYKSIENIELKFFESEEIKETLVNPKLALGHAYTDQLIGIEEAINPSTLTSRFKPKRSELGSRSQLGVDKIGKGLIKGPSMFMVMDNLTVTPLSPSSGMSFINKLQIPLADIGEREVTMGEDEAFRLLVASLVSKCALTDAFLIKEPEQEQMNERVLFFTYFKQILSKCFTLEEEEEDGIYVKDWLR